MCSFLLKALLTKVMVGICCLLEVYQVPSLPAQETVYEGQSSKYWDEDHSCGYYRVGQAWDNLGEGVLDNIVTGVPAPQWAREVMVNRNHTHKLLLR